MAHAFVAASTAVSSELHDRALSGDQSPSRGRKVGARHAFLEREDVGGVGVVAVDPEDREVRGPLRGTQRTECAVGRDETWSQYGVGTVVDDASARRDLEILAARDDATVLAADDA